jgi:hypothetical protein
MTNPTLTDGTQIADSAQGQASNFVPTNLKVTSGGLPLSVQSDVPLFPGSSPALTITGTWTIAGSRVTVNGIGVINASSVGVGYNPFPAPTGALQISPGNQNVLVKF